MLLKTEDRGGWVQTGQSFNRHETTADDHGRRRRGQCFRRRRQRRRRPSREPFQGPWWKRKKGPGREKHQKVQGEESARNLDGDDVGESGCRSGWLRPHATPFVADDAREEGFKEKPTSQPEQQLWWFKLRRFGSRFISQGHESGAFPQQDASKDSGAATPHREGVRSRDQRRARGLPGPILDGERLHPSDELGQVQGLVPGYDDGRGRVRVPDKSRTRHSCCTSGAEHQGKDAVRTRPGRVAHSMAFDGSGRPSHPKGVRWNPRRTSSGLGLCVIPEQASATSQGGREPGCCGGSGGQVGSGAGGQSVQVNSDGGVGDPFLTGRNTKFRRFYTWQSRIQGALPERSGSSTMKVSFPCVLPFPEVVSVGKILRRASTRKVVWAKRWVNCLFSFYNFVELGCPDRVEHYEPRGPEVRTAGERVFGEIMTFSSLGIQEFSHKCESGGKEEVQNLLAAMEDPSFSYFSKPLDLTMTTALPVHASRIAIPSTAGTVDMLQHLPPERAKIVADLERLRLPEHLWNRIPIASHQVEQCEEAGVARRLLQSKMVVPVKASELPR